VSLNVRAELDVRGIPEVVAWFEGEFSVAAQNAAFDATDETLDEAVELAKRGAPVGTPASTGIPGYIGGSHRKSIRKERLAKPKNFYTYQGIRAGGYVTNPNTGIKVDYSHILEYGSAGGRFAPRPHIRPALKKATRGLPKRFYFHLGRRIKLE